MLIDVFVVGVLIDVGVGVSGGVFVSGSVVVFGGVNVRCVTIPPRGVV